MSKAGGEPAAADADKKYVVSILKWSSHIGLD
jgi:hypothetical protein